MNPPTTLIWNRSQRLTMHLKDFPGAVLFTSHDHEFTQTVANRIIEITPKGHIDRLITYDEYIENESIAAQKATLYA
jgi:ATPase subunit of ABC transporter with duplicated ATPase domains